MVIISPESGVNDSGDFCSPEPNETGLQLAEEILAPRAEIASGSSGEEAFEVLDAVVLGGDQGSVEPSQTGRHYIPRHAKPHENLRQRASRAWSVTRLAGQTAIAATLLSPANEAIRAAVIGIGAVYSRSPEMTAATAGGSTFVVELVGGLAAASVMEAGVSQRVARALNKRLPDSVREQGLSSVTKGAIVLASGTVVGMAVEHIENPGRTKVEDQRYALMASTALGGALAIAGAAGTSVLGAAAENPGISIPAAGGVVMLETGRRILRRLRFPRRVEDIETETWQDSDEFASYHLTIDPEELGRAAIVEQDVWTEKGYGDLGEEGYEVHIANSRTFVGVAETGECVGVTRLFGANAEEGVVPPFLELEFDDAEVHERLEARALGGLVEELGTTSVVEPLRHKGVNARMWREAYRDSAARGVEEWGIIMEPDRVERMNKKYGFTFKQLGPAVDYQGGMCAPFSARLDDLVKNMQYKKPLVHYWFVRKRLNR